MISKLGFQKGAYAIARRYGITLARFDIIAGSEVEGEIGKEIDGIDPLKKYSLLEINSHKRLCPYNPMLEVPARKTTQADVVSKTDR